MNPGKLTQGLLAVIAILLGWSAIKPFLPTTTVHAAAPVEYKFAVIGGGFGPAALTNAEQQLNALSKDGWTFVACPGGFGQCIFKK